MKLNTMAFALAFGLWWGGGLFIATWWLLAQGGGTAGPMLLDRFYYGYSLTPLGSVVGFGWGFVCGAICGAILAWLYNFFAEKFVA
jgi:hypothetical protein